MSRDTPTATVEELSEDEIAPLRVEIELPSDSDVDPDELETVAVAVERA